MGYQKDIFLDYYFSFDNRFNGVRDYSLKNVSIVHVRETNKGIDYFIISKEKKKVLVINFDKNRSNNTFLKNTDFLKNQEVEILDFWNPEMKVKF